jgi:cytidine deaminase
VTTQHLETGREAEDDAELLRAAADAIRRNYDPTGERHTVGAAVRCGGGKVYAGVNVYHLHGACAEVIVLGMAITAGEREFISIVAVRGAEGGEVVPPCGNCRQILVDYAPECDVVMPSPAAPGGYTRVKAKDLLPGAYHLYPSP